MSKFCPKCGNQMSDNAKFCMECGTNLEDYTSGGVEIKDNVIQRSQIGTSSVGTVAISPEIFLNESTTQDGLCPKCGFKMIEQKPFSFFMPCEDFGLIIDVKSPYKNGQVGYLCPKCSYKFLINSEIYSKFACKDCKKVLNISSSFLSGEIGKCPECKRKWKTVHLKTTKKSICDSFKSLEKMGWDTSLI